LIILLLLPQSVLIGQMKADKDIPWEHECRIPDTSEILNYKEVPEEITYQVAMALLHYPELQNVPIIFRFAGQTPPLTSRPKLLHIFKKAGKRTYIVTISNKTKKRVAPILFKNLDTKAQIGVLGHELAHIADYEIMTSLELLALPFKLLSTTYVNRFELATDQSCIDHGLGDFLMHWSTTVREKLGVDQWKGYRQTFAGNRKKSSGKRYMDPEMIRLAMRHCEALP
jgi:predicted SprT family Zn-dependent metalloprotease